MCALSPSGALTVEQHPKPQTRMVIVTTFRAPKMWQAVLASAVQALLLYKRIYTLGPPIT